MGSRIDHRLRDILEKKKRPVVDKWIKAIQSTYPPETEKFLRREPNQFANPIGASIRESVWPLYDQIIGDAVPEIAKKHLDTLIRVRAVQDFAPTGAVHVIFELKQIVRQEIFKEVQERGLVSEYLEFESEIDRFALLAFDVFMECREKVWEIKKNDFFKRPYYLTVGGMCPSYMLKRGQKHLEKLKKERTRH